MKNKELIEKYKNGIISMVLSLSVYDTKTKIKNEIKDIRAFCMTLRELMIGK